MRSLWVALVVCLFTVGTTGAGETGRLTVDLGNAVTFGKFTYDDATIDIEGELFNPRGALEYQFAELPLAVGLEASMSENTFTGDYDDGDGDSGEGEVDIERQEMALYLKFVPNNTFSFRIGYRNFNYDLSNADITQYENGAIDERDINGVADCSLATGIDTQLGLIFGSPDALQLGLTLGYTYFIDAEYDWEYDEVIGAATTHRTGSATANAHSLRIRPEVSFPLTDAVRLYADWCIAATAWDADLPDEDPSYPGFDMYSGVSVGVRYAFDL